MNKKGFTLIELLAVILILGVIALIVVFVVSNIIKHTKTQAAVSSLYGYIKAVENNIAIGHIDSNNGIIVPEDKDLTSTNNDDILILSKIRVKGKGPDYVSIKFEDDDIKSGKFCVNNFSLDYDGSKVSISDNNYCNGVVVRDITIENNVSELTMQRDGTLQLNVKTDPEGQSVNYASSNESIATVNATGLVTGIANGTATITATSGIKSSSVEVTIIKKDTDGFDETKGVNKPVLAVGMTPVKWDASNNEITTTESDPSWYDYANKKWANAKTADGSYWVWIPRYAYKITSGYHSGTTGTISIKFLEGITNVTADNTNILSSGYEAGVKDTSTNYFLHPAFNFDGQAKGFWVAKYEPTASEGVANGYTSDFACPTNGDNVTTKTIKIVPNAKSWRCIDAKTSYNLVLNMKNKSTYGWNSNQVDTHIIKNTEWGAIAYLTQSTYGANTEIVLNNADNYTTGCAANTVSQWSSSGCVNAYNTANGVKSSTTLNITGIYDMSGGAWERSIANYNNLGAVSGFTNTEVTNIPNKYINRYATPVANLMNGIGMDYDKTVYGDAMYETSDQAIRYNGSGWAGIQSGCWYGDQGNIPHTASPWFYRGGYFSNGAFAGVFTFTIADGGANSYTTFRPIFIVID